jgi:hypothetical protein
MDKGSFSNLGRTFSCGNESSMRKSDGKILLGDNIRGGAFMLRPVSGSSVVDFGFQVDCLVYTYRCTLLLCIGYSVPTCAGPSVT